VIEHVARHHQGIYCQSSRRWIEVSLQLCEGQDFRRECFLLDTGSPVSIMVEELAQEIIKYNFNPQDKDRADIDIEGLRIGFNLQPRDAGDERTKNINLLGTNFLNNVVCIDDYISQNLLILKRAPLPKMRI